MYILVYSDDTVSTGYKTNVNFVPNVNDLKRVTYNTRFDDSPNESSFENDVAFSGVEESIHTVSFFQ